jgi:hypothetical protein
MMLVSIPRKLRRGSPGDGFTVNVDVAFRGIYSNYGMNLQKLNDAGHRARVWEVACAAACA